MFELAGGGGPIVDKSLATSTSNTSKSSDIFEITLDPIDYYKYQTYGFQFAWKYADGTKGIWSATYFVKPDKHSTYITNNMYKTV